MYSSDRIRQGYYKIRFLRTLQLKLDMVSLRRQAVIALMSVLSE